MTKIKVALEEAEPSANKKNRSPRKREPPAQKEGQSEPSPLGTGTREKGLLKNLGDSKTIKGYRKKGLIEGNPALETLPMEK